MYSGDWRPRVVNFVDTGDTNVILEVVAMTTTGADNDDIVGIMMTLDLQGCYLRNIYDANLKGMSKYISTLGSIKSWQIKQSVLPWAPIRVFESTCI